MLDSSDSSSAIGYYSANGLAPALEQNTGKVGFVDKDGVFVIEPIYDDAGPFSDDGIALAVKYIDGESKYGYINSKGEEVIPFIYDNATSFYNFGYAVVSVYEDEETKYFIIDKKGNTIIELNGRSVELTKDYFITTENDEQIIFDYSGNKVFSLKYDYNAEQYDKIIVKGNDIFKYTYKFK